MLHIDKARNVFLSMEKLNKTKMSGAKKMLKSPINNFGHRRWGVSGHQTNQPTNKINKNPQNLKNQGGRGWLTWLLFYKFEDLSSILKTHWAWNALEMPALARQRLGNPMLSRSAHLA